MEKTNMVSKAIHLHVATNMAKAIHLKVATRMVEAIHPEVATNMVEAMHMDATTFMVEGSHLEENQNGPSYPSTWSNHHRHWPFTYMPSQLVILIL